MSASRAELLRLMRAVHLEAERQADGVYLVTGPSAPHRADRRQCSCGDFRRRHAPCQHVLRVRLAEGDAATIRLLRELLPLPAEDPRAPSAAQRIRVGELVP